MEEGQRAMDWGLEGKVVRGGLGGWGLRNDIPLSTPHMWAACIFTGRPWEPRQQGRHTLASCITNSQNTSYTTIHIAVMTTFTTRDPNIQQSVTYMPIISNINIGIDFLKVIWSHGHWYLFNLFDALCAELKLLNYKHTPEVKRNIIANSAIVFAGNRFVIIFNI